MLKEQHIPRSVGKVVKIAEHEIGTPFHSQYLKTELCALSDNDVMFLMSKQGKDEYQSVEKRY